jgi:hypothetical protein
VVTAGYRYLIAPDSSSTNRMELTATSHFPTKPGVLLSDRNRSDLDWSDGKFKWRYRNKLEIEKPLGDPFVPSRALLQRRGVLRKSVSKMEHHRNLCGLSFSIRKRFEFDTYYEHQNNTGKSPNRQLHGIGLTLNRYLSAKILSDFFRNILQ